MNYHKAASEAFAVLQFTLVVTAEGKATQQTTPCGKFESVEKAFDSARTRAVAECKRLCAEAGAPRFRTGAEDDEAEENAVALLDTEWGYDIYRGHLVVSRFWVHDRSPCLPA